MYVDPSPHSFVAGKAWTRLDATISRALLSNDYGRPAYGAVLKKHAAAMSTPLKRIHGEATGTSPLVSPRKVSFEAKNSCSAIVTRTRNIRKHSILAHQQNIYSVVGTAHHFCLLHHSKPALLRHILSVGQQSKATPRSQVLPQIICSSTREPIHRYPVASLHNILQIPRASSHLPSSTRVSNCTIHPHSHQDDLRPIRPSSNRSTHPAIAIHALHPGTHSTQIRARRIGSRRTSSPPASAEETLHAKVCRCTRWRAWSSSSSLAHLKKQEKQADPSVGCAKRCRGR